VADSEELKSWILRNRRGANPPPPILRNIHRAQELQLRINAEEVRFLRTDVELGLKFSEIALQTTDRNKTNRNRANAQKAYEAVLHLLPKVSLTAEENGVIRVKLTQLKSNLEQLRHKT
jgi:hypothetical protein